MGLLILYHKREYQFKEVNRMKAVGVVVEYNPFHNGHAYHVKKAREQTRCEVAVAVMSGPFLQRGEPAIISKRSRTRMALQNGIDILIELPYVFATQKAETFAEGAVSLLASLGCESLFFGSEDGKIGSFLEAASNYNKSRLKIDQSVQSFLKEGSSFPKAMSLAFKEAFTSEHSLDLSKPNNILGFHYVKAIADKKLAMEPATAKRISAEFHDPVLPSGKNRIASATSIRKELLNERETTSIKPYLPETTATELNAYYRSYNIWHSFESYFPLLKYRLNSMTKSELKQMYEVEEGLENRILKVIKHARSFEEYMENLKTKRYTWTRLQRMNVHILTNTTKEAMETALGDSPIPNVRLLGLTRKGQAYLSARKKDLQVKVVTKAASLSHPALELDLKASRVYAAAIREPLQTEFLKEEFSHLPVLYDEQKKMFLR
jgi:predicted nucleotidyltransferase